MAIKLKYVLFALLVMLQLDLSAAFVKVGTGRMVITPELPFYLTGYAARDSMATTKVHDLWAKAIVIEENPSSRIVIVTTDVLGLTPAVSEAAAERLKKKYGIARSQIMFNSSHTHSGPMIWPALSVIGDYDAETIKRFTSYTVSLTDKLVAAVDMAMQSLEPMQLSHGTGNAGFALNRRYKPGPDAATGKERSNRSDHDVPVLLARDAKGVVKAVVFGYACHNTTMTGEHNSVNGDYAGFAQIEVEKKYPDATALFVLGCAGDQNPMPRGTLEYTEQHGKELAAAVEKVVDGKMENIGAPLRSAFVRTELPYQPVTVETFQKELQEGTKYEKRRAKLIMEARDKGWDLSNHNYPVQAMRIGNKLTILSLSGEVVVDYSLNAKKQYPGEHLFVAGYCNQVVCYIPTERIIEEGGYEPVSSQMYYGMPGPFEKSVEVKVNAAISTVMQKVGLHKK
ncbi:neutral/alkaline non-lysosomal ceramidase N-terminal domain-containing protein [Chitinophaga barathri]|nr:neutral/alkaline non-lysosomal ceramidase N-terminal domain-containing protein [Chitinophaga barathri]